MEQPRRALSWRSLLWAAAGLLVAVLGAACSKAEDPYLETSRCFYAATALNEPLLLAASTSWAEKHLSDSRPNNRDAFIWAEQIQKELAPDGLRTSTRTVLDVADKWKRSSHCQAVLTEFQQEVPKIIAKAATPQTDNKCESLRAQLFVMNDAVLGKPKQQVLPGVVGTLNNTLANFSPEKQQYLKAELAKTPQEFIEHVTRSCSTALKGDLTVAVNDSGVATAYVSERTKTLRVSKRSEGNCGEVPEVYCRGDIEQSIVNPLRNKSEQCDKQFKLAGDCEWSADSVVAAQVLEAELQILKKARGSLERYLADPESADAGFRSKVNDLANRCRADAMYKGMKGNALFDYANGTCMPAARQQLISAKEQMLRRVSARLEQLSAAAPAPRASEPASSPSS